MIIQSQPFPHRKSGYALIDHRDVQVVLDVQDAGLAAATRQIGFNPPQARYPQSACASDPPGRAPRPTRQKYGSYPCFPLLIELSGRGAPGAR